MKIGISFTTLLHDLHDRKLALADLDEAHLGCQREHVFPLFPKQDFVPFEVTWLNKKARHLHGEEGSEIDPNKAEIEPEALETWETFREWLWDMDQAGKVFYSVGNYHELAVKLLRGGHAPWYHGWKTAEDYAYELGLKEAI